MTKLTPGTTNYDPKSAVDLLEKGAAAGSPEAQFRLARVYERGNGVTVDLVRALDLYQAAAAQDYGEAVNEIGFFYFTGALGLPLDQAEALKQFQRAADLKHPEAMFNFASFVNAGLVPGLGPTDAAGYLYQALRGGSRKVLDALIDNSGMFSTETRTALQAKLAENKLYDGPLDGSFGPATRRSIRAAFGILEVED